VAGMAAPEDAGGAEETSDGEEPAGTPKEQNAPEAEEEALAADSTEEFKSVLAAEEVKEDASDECAREEAEGAADENELLMLEWRCEGWACGTNGEPNATFAIPSVTAALGVPAPLARFDADIPPGPALPRAWYTAEEAEDEAGLKGSKDASSSGSSSPGEARPALWRFLERATNVEAEEGTANALGRGVLTDEAAEAGSSGAGAEDGAGATAANALCSALRGAFCNEACCSFRCTAPINPDAPSLLPALPPPSRWGRLGATRLLALMLLRRLWRLLAGWTPALAYAECAPPPPARYTHPPDETRASQHKQEGGEVVDWSTVCVSVFCRCCLVVPRWILSARRLGGKASRALVRPPGWG